MKIYLATAGEYSDYRVVAVFTRREDAEAYPLGDDVEEYELYEGPVEVRDWHSLGWHANLPDRPGDAYNPPNPLESSNLRDFDGHPNRVQHQWVKLPFRDSTDHLTVEGWDLQRVRKVYSEQRAQHIARRNMGVQP